MLLSVWQVCIMLWSGCVQCLLRLRITAPALLYAMSEGASRIAEAVKHLPVLKACSSHCLERYLACLDPRTATVLHAAVDSYKSTFLAARIVMHSALGFSQFIKSLFALLFNNPIFGIKSQITFTIAITLFVWFVLSFCWKVCKYVWMLMSAPAAAAQMMGAGVCFSWVCYLVAVLGVVALLLSGA